MSSVDFQMDILNSQEDTLTRVVSMEERDNCCNNITTPSVPYDVLILGNISVYTNMSNSGYEAGPMEYPLYLMLYFTIVNCLVFLVGIIGNILVIQVIARMKNMRTRMNYYLMSLSIADLLVLMVCQPSAMLEFYGKDRWLIGEAMCKIVPFLEHASLHSSGFTLLTIGFERYLAICHPLKEQRGYHLANSCTVITIIWFVAYILSLPFVFITFLEEAEHNDGSVVKVCRTRSGNTWQRAYIMFVFVVLFALPLCLLVFMYAGIILKMCRITAESCPGDYTNAKTIKSRKQVIYMLIALMLLFFLCLLPIRIVILVMVFVSPAKLQAMGFEVYLNLLSIVRIMMYINSAGNPIIYGLLSTKFRTAFKRSFPQCSEGQQPRESVASTRRTGKNTCMIPMNAMYGCNGTAI